jgi:hypothetical protein
MTDLDRLTDELTGRRVEIITSYDTQAGDLTRESAASIVSLFLRAQGKEPVTEPDGTRVTVGQLARALDRDFIAVTTGAVTARGAPWVRLQSPEALAETLMEDITGGSHPMPVAVEIADDEPEPEPERERGYYDGKTGMQPFDVVDEFGLDFYEGNVVKYVVRWRKKNGVADLRKARTYINALIKRAEDEHPF